jgi:hypothetical protein
MRSDLRKEITERKTFLELTNRKIMGGYREKCHEQNTHGLDATTLSINRTICRG